MVRYTGKLTLSDEGLSMNIPISSSNEERYDVPLMELFDELLGKEVTIDINRVVRFSEEVSRGGED